MDGSTLWRAALIQALAVIPSAAAVLAGLHWLGVAIAIIAFAAWCGWIAARREAIGWT